MWMWQEGTVSLLDFHRGWFEEPATVRRVFYILVESTLCWGRFCHVARGSSWGDLLSDEEPAGGNGDFGSIIHW